MSVSLSLIQVANAADNSAAFGAVLNPIIDNVVYPLVMLAFAVGLLVFVYGVAQLMMNPADSDAHKRGRMSIIGGIIGMFIMLSAWGIIYFVSNTVKGFN